MVACPLEVKELFRAFRMEDAETQVLKDVSFTVQPGEFVAVMGQSGSGKSTLLHIAAGLLPATGGSVTVAGEDVTRLDEQGRAALRRGKVGYVFQNFHLMPQLTAEENVGLPLRVAGVDPGTRREEIEALMTRMDVWKRRDHRPHQMSGGELQRVSIARALVNDPPLLLADEPTGNLASASGEVVMGILREAVADGRRAILMVTHNPYDAARADRVLFLKDGVIDPAMELKGEDLDATRVLDRLKELGI